MIKTPSHRFNRENITGLIEILCLRYALLTSRFDRGSIVEYNTGLIEILSLRYALLTSRFDRENITTVMEIVALGVGGVIVKISSGA